LGEAALSILDKKNQLHAPDFLLLEMDSIICKWVRRCVVTPMEGSNLRSALRQYPLQHHSFVPILDSAFAIATQTRQSIYDCLYVALAALLKGRMVTADRKLCEDLKNGPFKKHVVWVADIQN
jgi:predicted nucleic acid-binding protein